MTEMYYYCVEVSYQCANYKIIMQFIKTLFFKEYKETSHRF